MAIRKRYFVVAPIGAGIGGAVGFTRAGFWGAVIGTAVGLVGGLMATAGVSAAMDWNLKRQAEKHLGIDQK